MNPVPPYAGQNQTSKIAVPAPIAYKYIDGEEGPWAQAPYQWFYPTPVYLEPPRLAYIPPPIYKTELWRAQQTWPL